MTASRVHYNLDLQFNSQSTIVAFTESPSLGGRAWPTVLFSDEDDEYIFALWCNSTLGLVSHWWMSNKTQAGRGNVYHHQHSDIPYVGLPRFYRKAAIGSSRSVCRSARRTSSAVRSGRRG